MSHRRAELLWRHTLGVVWAVPKTVPTCLAWKRCPGSNVRHSMHVIMSSIETYPISLSLKCVFPLIFRWRKLYQKTWFWERLPRELFSNHFLPWMTEVDHRFGLSILSGSAPSYRACNLWWLNWKNCLNAINRPVSRKCQLLNHIC